MANLIKAFLSRMPAGASLMCVSTDDIIMVRRASLREHLATAKGNPVGEVRAEDLDLPGYSVSGVHDTTAATWVPENRWDDEFGKFYPNGHAPYDIAVTWMQRGLSANLITWPSNMYAVCVDDVDDPDADKDVCVLIATAMGVRFIGAPNDAERTAALWHVRVPQNDTERDGKRPAVGRNLPPRTYSEVSLFLVSQGMTARRDAWPANKMVQWTPEPGKGAESFKPPMNYLSVQEITDDEVICTAGPLTQEDLEACDWYVSFPKYLPC